MANRDMNHLSYSFEKARKVVTARLSFGASGAPTLDGPNSKGVLSVTRQSAGQYTLQLGVSVNSLSQLDFYVKLLAIEWVPDIAAITGAAPAAVGQLALVRNDLQSGASLAPPVQNAPSTSTTGGTGLAAATQYFYKVTALDFNGTESLVSNEQNITTGAGGTNSNTVNWTAVAGAASYRVYRGTATNAENVVYAVAGGATATFLDTGAASQASAAAPVIPARPPFAAASLTVQTLNGSGVATDPANGEGAFIQLDLGDSGAP